MSLWIPGPTEVRPEILAECARPMIGHRTEAMSALVARLDPGLRLAFGIDDDSPAQVAAHTCSATGLMEAALHGVAGRVLSIVGGAFGQRWHQVAQGLGRETVALDVEWGDCVSAEALDRALREEGPFAAVTLVCNETSTGARTPLARVAEVMERYPDTLLLVDVVSYLAGGPVDFDRHRLDFCLAGSQKALALPPGLAVFCVSPRYVERAQAVPHRGYYLDPLKILQGHVQRKTPSTPCIPLYYALARQLEDITAGVNLPATERPPSGAAAWNARFNVHARMQARTAEWAARRGLEPLPSAEHASPTVSCIRSESIDTPALVTGLKQRGFEISNGYGDLKNKTFRIGHMGDHTEAELEELLSAADEVLGAA